MPRPVPAWSGVKVPDTVRVYVNGRGVDAPVGASLLDAIRLADTQEAELVATGQRSVTDSRGLPVDGATSLYGGAIFRTVSARQRATEL